MNRLCRRDLQCHHGAGERICLLPGITGFSRCIINTRPAFTFCAAAFAAQTVATHGEELCFATAGAIRGIGVIAGIYNMLRQRFFRDEVSKFVLQASFSNMLRARLRQALQVIS